jgi:hypothetical protein
LSRVPRELIRSAFDSVIASNGTISRRVAGFSFAYNTVAASDETIGIIADITVWCAAAVAGDAGGNGSECALGGALSRVPRELIRSAFDSVIASSGTISRWVADFAVAHNAVAASDGTIGIIADSAVRCAAAVAGDAGGNGSECALGGALSRVPEELIRSTFDSVIASSGTISRRVADFSFAYNTVAASDETIGIIADITVWCAAAVAGDAGVNGREGAPGGALSRISRELIISAFDSVIASSGTVSRRVAGFSFAHNTVAASDGTI